MIYNDWSNEKHLYENMYPSAQCWKIEDAAVRLVTARFCISQTVMQLVFKVFISIIWSQIGETISKHIRNSARKQNIADIWIY